MQDQEPTQMREMDRRNWFSAFLMLQHLICVSSSPHLLVAHTSSKVGLPAVLPCTMALHELDHKPHIQWQTDSNSVFERMGQELFQGEEYRDRADVPEEMLRRGNCSLYLQDLRFSDAGVYESYLVVGESRIKSRIFLQSVHLAVVDHKTKQLVKNGSDLILDLYTRQAEQVIFQKSDDTEWTVLWERDAVKKKDKNLKVTGDKLFLSRVSASSAGTYKVLDSQGLALSTVMVTVTESVLPKESEILQIQSAFGDAVTIAPHLSLITLLSVFHAMLQMY